MAIADWLLLGLVLGGSGIWCRTRKATDIRAPIKTRSCHLIVPRQPLLAMPGSHSDTWPPCPRFPVQGDVATSGTRDVTHFQKGSLLLGKKLFSLVHAEEQQNNPVRLESADRQG